MSASRDPLPENVVAALKLGQTIEAIKLLRESTGLGLKEAKDAIDQHSAPAPAPSRSVGAMLTLPFAVTHALRSGNKLEAIRLMREKGGLGLREAKDAVDAFERENSAGAGQASPGEVPRSKGGLWLLLIVIAAALAGYYYFVRRSA